MCFKIVRTIKPIRTIDIHTMASILLDKLEEMGCEADIMLPIMKGLPDTDCKIYRKKDVENYSKLKEISELEYVQQKHDCDDFSAKLFGEFAGLVWTNNHALNFFVDENETFWFIEPQTAELSRNLVGEWGIRFFIGR